MAMEGGVEEEGQCIAKYSLVMSKRMGLFLLSDGGKENTPSKCSSNSFSFEVRLPLSVPCAKKEKFSSIKCSERDDSSNIEDGVGSNAEGSIFSLFHSIFFENTSRDAGSAEDVGRIGVNFGVRNDSPSSKCLLGTKESDDREDENKLIDEEDEETGVCMKLEPLPNSVGPQRLELDADFRGVRDRLQVWPASASHGSIVQGNGEEKRYNPNRQTAAVCAGKPICL